MRGTSSPTVTSSGARIACRGSAVPWCSTNPRGGRTHFDLAEHWERAATEFRAGLPKYFVTVLADTVAMPWIRYRGWRVQSEEPAGERVRVALRFDADYEALQFALSLGSHVEVLEPVELRERIRSAAADIVELYGDTDDGKVVSVSSS